MKKESKEIMRIISEWKGSFDCPYSIREDGKNIDRKDFGDVKIVPKADNKGLDVYVKDGAKNARVAIPSCITHSGIDEDVYNDFHIGEDSVVTIDAGCGIHSEQGMSRHSGKHRFFIGKNSHVTYLEKHVGLGKEGAKRVMDPYSEIHLEEGSTLDMEVSQIGGLEESHRITKAFLDKDSTLKVKESLLTEKRQMARTDFHVELNGDSSNADIVSRSVAKDESRQEYTSRIVGNARCTGHSECDAIITGEGKVYASPALDAVNEDASLIHEAAIGKIAGEQIMKLKTLGLSEEEAEERIIIGFLS